MVTINLTNDEKRALIYLCDKALVNLEVWADKAHFSIDEDPEYQELCGTLCDMEWGGDCALDASPITLADVVDFSDNVKAYSKKTVFHMWKLMNRGTGEVFFLTGKPGQDRGDAMEEHGLTDAAWELLGRQF